MPNGTTRPALSVGQRISLWLINRLPPILVRETERVILSITVTLVGLTSLMATSESGSVSRVLPRWALIEWSITLLLGGAFTLVGMFRGKRMIERVGIALTAVGSITYAATLMAIGPVRGKVIALVFFAIAFACLIRMASSTAANAIAEHNGGPR